MNKIQRQEIASTAINQLGGMGRLGAMINARDFMILKAGAQFRFSGSRKANVVKIKLSENDTYTIEFWKSRGIKWNKVEEFDGVYADQMISIFQDVTGLALSL